MTTKTADSKGRVALGKAFANSQVIVQRISPTEIRIIKARVIPEDESWLWENETALGMVPANERFDADEPLRPHVDLGLIVEDKLLVIDRLSQTRLEPETVQRRDAHVGAVEPEEVVTPFLGPVHRSVGVPK